MIFDPSEENELIRATVRQFAEEQLLAGALERDKQHQFAERQAREFAGMGFLGMTIPEEYGGAPLEDVSEAIVVEELSRCDAAFGVFVAVHCGLVSKTIVRWGTPEQKQRYLPQLAAGQVYGAYSLSEYGAGSDAAALSCRAERRGDHYRLNGTKAWVTNGANAGLYVLMARTDPDAPKAKGITAFLVERDTPGFKIGKLEDKLGINASDTAELILENVDLPADSVLGGEGMGFKVALNALDVSRIGIAAQAVGIAQGAYECARRYAGERQAFGQPILQFQTIGNYLADMATRIEAARLLTYRAAYLKGKGTKHTRESSQAKLFASETAIWVAEKAVQVLGGYGFTTDYPAERYYREAKITTIYEGTSEIQRVVIARNLP
jgi:alkylation response protein AidB-like acyl-CoA dehydrogenase